MTLLNRITSFKFIFIWKKNSSIFNTILTFLINIFKQRSVQNWLFQAALLLIFTIFCHKVNRARQFKLKKAIQYSKLFYSDNLAAVIWNNIDQPWLPLKVVWSFYVSFELQNFPTKTLNNYYLNLKKSYSNFYNGLT